MEICLITPFDNLKEMIKNGDIYYFALTRQLKENREYYNSFKELKKQESKIIVDNNVHESDEVNFEEHVKLAIEVGTEIVIPDSLRNKKKTLEYFHYFLDKFYNELRRNNVKLIGVPQGNSYKEIIECFDEMNNDKRVDVIGNSFDLEPFQFVDDKYKNQSMNRVILMNDFLRKTKKPIHLFGSNGLWELFILNKFYKVRSTDGKLFSRLALGNVKLTNDNWPNIFKPDVKMDFNDKFTLEQVGIFNHNIKFFRRLIK